MDRRAFLALPAILALPRPALAAMRRYELVAGASSVAFVFTAAGIPLRGTMPFALADIRIDPARLTASRVDVSADASRARTKAAYAQSPMTGPEVLDVANHPRIRFRSDRITLGPDGRISKGATISGPLTLRGVTRPATFTAALFRVRGSKPTDLDDLTVRLKGAVSRRAFGITGYQGMVADAVSLNITARVRAA